MKTALTDQQIEFRLNWLEGQIAAERDTRQLAEYARLFRSLFDEQVRRDLCHWPEYTKLQIGLDEDSA